MTGKWQINKVMMILLGMQLHIDGGNKHKHKRRNYQHNRVIGQNRKSTDGVWHGQKQGRKSGDGVQREQNLLNVTANADRVMKDRDDDSENNGVQQHLRSAAGYTVSNSRTKWPSDRYVSQQLNMMKRGSEVEVKSDDVKVKGSKVEVKDDEVEVKSDEVEIKGSEVLESKQQAELNAEKKQFLVRIVALNKRQMQLMQDGQVLLDLESESKNKIQSVQQELKRASKVNRQVLQQQLQLLKKDTVSLNTLQMQYYQVCKKFILELQQLLWDTSEYQGESKDIFAVQIIDLLKKLNKDKQACNDVEKTRSVIMNTSIILDKMHENVTRELYV